MTDLELMQQCILNSEDVDVTIFDSSEGLARDKVSSMRFQIALELFRHRIRFLPGNPLKQEPQSE